MDNSEKIENSEDFECISGILLNFKDSVEIKAVSVWNNNPNNVSKINFFIFFIFFIFKLYNKVIINDNQTSKNRTNFELSNNTTQKVQCQTTLFK